MSPSASDRRVVRWVATFAILVIAAACSSPGSGSSAATAASPSSSPSQAIASTQGPAASPTVGTTQRERVEGQVLGSGTLPTYSVEVPGGWSSGGKFIMRSGVAVMGLSVWDVIQVPSDPCHWKGHLVDAGSTVADLVRLLVGQEGRNATKPTDVTLAGYSGTYLEWSVPADMVVTADSDFEGCDQQPSNGHLDFVSWLSSGGGERYQQVAGQVDRLWILDVDGKRLVVDATYSPDATEAARDELNGVAQSLKFANP